VADEETPQPAPSWVGSLRQPLSTYQTLVGLLAGIVTISGALASINGVSASAPPQGELVALVHDARQRRPVADATLEILTAQDALVTTLNVESDGRVTRRLKEGTYRLRVAHAGFVSETRAVEVHAGQRSEIRLALVPRPAARVVKVTTAEPEGPVRKFFKELGF
jgi:hypothetical protein